MAPKNSQEIIHYDSETIRFWPKTCWPAALFPYELIHYCVDKLFTTMDYRGKSCAMISDKNAVAQQIYFKEKRVTLERLAELLAMLSLVFIFLYIAQSKSNLPKASSSKVHTKARTKVSYQSLQGREYYFGGVKQTFGHLELDRLQGYTHAQLKEMILSSVPSKLRRRLQKYLASTLHMAEKYQVDPFWVLAVMWTESHFRPSVKSSAHAIGLMQIKPDTGSFLSSLMDRKHMSEKRARHLLYEPEINIEIGTYYLARLLNRFKGNYRLATVAYNMGPTRVRRRLRKKLQVGVKNQYLNKVRRAYGHLSRGYLNALSLGIPPKGDSYVMKRSLGERTYF